MRRRGALLACCVALAAAVGAESPRARGTPDLLPVLESAPWVVVGRVAAPESVDGEAYAAHLEVEHALVGEMARGTALRVVWEERARSRPPRFRAGERILVCLEPLPGHSIWSRRFPDWEERGALRFVADGGRAFLRAPPPGSVLLLEHYLALAPERREENAGVGYLARLAEGAPPSLARSAVLRLRSVPELDRALDPSSARRLVAALLRPDGGDALRDALLALVETRTPESLRDPLRALAPKADSGDPLAPAPVYAALARLGGALPQETIARLLARDDSAAHRAVGARYARGEDADALPRVLRVDPDARVRAAALERWLELRGPGAVDRALYALEDPDLDVRTAAIRGIGALGPEAVPALRALAKSGAREAARAAVGALRIVGGRDAFDTLVELAETHPDSGVRTLARAALGRPLGEAHD